MITVYTTFGDIQTTEKFIDTILKLKLAKCANIHPINSVYIWNKKVVKEDEIAVVFKTVSSKALLLENYLAKNHPYKIPIIETIKADKINSKYFEWLNKEEL
ncbi:divalent-cation tolerance protein CutA [bacterium]|nr:divalent-cation tolerance protein CutA [bacterium]